MYVHNTFIYYTYILLYFTILQLLIDFYLLYYYILHTKGTIIFINYDNIILTTVVISFITSTSNSV